MLIVNFESFSLILINCTPSGNLIVSCCEGHQTGIYLFDPENGRTTRLAGCPNGSEEGIAIAQNASFKEPNCLVVIDSMATTEFAPSRVRSLTLDFDLFNPS